MLAPIDPERPPQRPDPHSYGSAKSLAERSLYIASKRLGAKYAIVRPTCIYGPGQHLHNAIPTFLRASWEGKNPTVFDTVYTYAWFVTFGLSFGVYLALMRQRSTPASP